MRGPGSLGHRDRAWAPGAEGCSPGGFQLQQMGFDLKVCLKNKTKPAVPAGSLHKASPVEGQPGPQSPSSAWTTE